MIFKIYINISSYLWASPCIKPSGGQISKVLSSWGRFRCMPSEVGEVKELPFLNWGIPVEAAGGCGMVKRLHLLKFYTFLVF
jgi:hypothetical protein